MPFEKTELTKCAHSTLSKLAFAVLSQVRYDRPGKMKGADSLTDKHPCYLVWSAFSIGFDFLYFSQHKFSIDTMCDGIRNRHQDPKRLADLVRGILWAPRVHVMVSLIRSDRVDG